MWISAVACTSGCVESTEQLDNTPDAGDPQILAKIPDSVRQDLEQGRPRELLIELNDQLNDADASLARSVEPGHDGNADAEALKEKAERYRAVQELVLDQAPSATTHLHFQYKNIPLLHMQVDDLQSLVDMARLPEVRAVHEDRSMEHQLTDSLPLINQPAAESAGFLGAGTAVAVLDTGCDFTRSAFGSCTAAGAPGCKVAFANDFGTNDNVKDANGHGTNVSAIVLGVAPATKVLALDVFEGTLAKSSTILQAVDWVITNRDTYNIVAMNLSLGSGSYTSACGSDVFATGLENARTAGILAAVASGNDAKTTAIGSPACVPAAISVGAVYDANVGGISYTTCRDTSTAADKVTCFSNSASFLSMLAPGAPITAGGYTMTGTSQAAPHVAGAIAVARAAFPSEPVSATVSRLTTTGPTVTDPRNGVSLHRLDLNAALGGAGMVDTTAPVGALMINAGAVSTRTPNVTLGITGTDDGPSVTMCISNTTLCTTFVALAATKTWTLPAGDGLKTVYVTLKDRSGNRSTLSATITVDSKAPEGGVLTAAASDAQVQLSWTPATDAGSGVASYRLVMAMNAAPSCTTGTTLYTGTGTTYTHTGLTNGLIYGYHLCPSDSAGNVGAGSTLTARPTPELDAPTGQVSINQDALFTNKTAVTLTLAATDASGVASMCISNTLTCTTYVPFATTKSWSLGTLNGVATVRAWFRDIYGNTSTMPVSDTISVDSAPPTGSTISAVPADSSVALTWTTAVDAASGVASYKVVSGLNAPPTCALGTVVYSGTDMTTTVTNLVNGTLYGFRVCPSDTAGNVGSGGVITARPAPEFDGPTGSVVINQGAQYTSSRTVTLSFTAVDASTVTGVCMSSTTACSAFVAFAPTKTWTVNVANGVASVNVWFKDQFGNVSAAPVSDTIMMDTTAPSISGLTATAASGSVTLNWEAATDAASGLSTYKIRFQPKIAPSCTTGTEIYSGTNLTFTHTGLVNGSVYGYRVCAVDVAGNVGAGGTVLATPH